MAAADPHKPLRGDVSLLGDMLGQTLRAREGHDVFEIVERCFVHSRVFSS